MQDIANTATLTAPLPVATPAVTPAAAPAEPRCEDCGYYWERHCSQCDIWYCEICEFS